MDCNEALDLLYLSYEGQITPSQQALLNAHRRTCFACSAKLIQAEKFERLLRKVPQVTVPRGLEERILAHVGVGVGVGVAGGPRPAWKMPRFSFPRLQLNFGGVLAMGGVLAAAVVFVLVANTMISRMLPANSGVVTALVQGNLVSEGPSGRGTITGSEEISSGETLRNVTAQPATVAFSPNLSIRIAPSTQVQLGRVAFDNITGQVSVNTMRVDRGTVRIRETLYRDAAPVHVATRLATFVPTGTIFTVAQERKVTYLAVTQGMVAVYGPHKFFQVGSGKSLRILANGGVLWNKKPMK